jgi:hypothetical protein
VLVRLGARVKACHYTQLCVDFCGMGTVPICMLTDASVSRQFVYRKGVGRVKHIDVRYMWLQDAIDSPIYTVKNFPRIDNPNDLLTHTPTNNDLDKLLPLIGLYPFGVVKGAVEIVERMVRDHPAMEQRVASMALIILIKGTEGARPQIQKKSQEWDVGDFYFWVVHLLAVVGLISLMVWIVVARRRFCRSTER